MLRVQPIQANGLAKAWEKILSITGSPELVSFLPSLLTYDPQQRADDSIIMQHPFLKQPAESSTTATAIFRADGAALFCASQS